MIRIGRTCLNPSLSKFKTQKSSSGAQIKGLGWNGCPCVNLGVLYDSINENRRSKGSLEVVFNSVSDSDWEVLPKSFDIYMQDYIKIRKSSLTLDQAVEEEYRRMYGSKGSIR